MIGLQILQSKHERRAGPFPVEMALVFVQLVNMPCFSRGSWDEGQPHAEKNTDIDWLPRCCWRTSEKRLERTFRVMSWLCLSGNHMAMAFVSASRWIVSSQDQVPLLLGGGCSTTSFLWWLKSFSFPSLSYYRPAYGHLLMKAVSKAIKLLHQDVLMPTALFYLVFFLPNIHIHECHSKYYASMLCCQTACYGRELD